MDLQKMVDSMNQMQSDTRAEYHLTYGQLVDALKNAPKDAKLDKRVIGIGSWRGSYIEIALFTDESGVSWEDEEYTSSYGDEYNKWAEQHDHSVEELPKTANELGELLESLIGKDFVGYKGGNFTITRNKPLWLEKDTSTSASVAVIGVDESLKLKTKKIED